MLSNMKNGGGGQGRQRGEKDKEQHTSGQGGGPRNQRALGTPSPHHRALSWEASLGPAGSSRPASKAKHTSNDPKTPIRKLVSR